MKILIYIEPHPIRNRYESFKWVALQYAQMIKDEYISKKGGAYEPDDIRILLSRHYADVAKEFPELKSVFLGMTKDENDGLSYWMRDWDKDVTGVDLWKQLMRGEGEVSEFYKRILARVKKDSFDFDIVINWATNGAVRGFCEENGLKNVSMELGCTRKPIHDTVFFDAHGISGNAITRHADLSIVEPLSMDLLRSMLPFKLQFDKGIDASFQPLASAHRDTIYANVGRNVLITLQLQDDANLLMFSKYRSMLEMIKEVVPSLHEAGYTCYVKPHPMAKHRPMSLSDHESVKSFISEGDIAVWLDDIKDEHDYLSLIDKMDYVVSINSSLAFEAMLMDKIVIPLGDSPFSSGDSFPKLSNMISGNIDQKAYFEMSKRIVNLLVRHYLVPKGFAFDFPFFSEYVMRACEAKNVFDSEGSSALTKFLQKRDLINHRIKSQLVTPTVRASHAKHAPIPVAVTSSPVSAVVQKISTVEIIEPISIQKSDLSPEKSSDNGRSDRMHRLVRKFKRDPARFLMDSKFVPLRKVGQVWSRFQ